MTDGCRLTGCSIAGTVTEGSDTVGVLIEGSKVTEGKDIAGVAHRRELMAGR